jgi:hypothetical protein
MAVEQLIYNCNIREFKRDNNPLKTPCVLVCLSLSIFGKKNMTSQKGFLQFASGSGTKQPINTIVVIDESYSMGSCDFIPNRLSGAIDATRALIEEKRRLRPQDYVGLVGFSREANIYSYGASVSQQYEQLMAALSQFQIKSETNFTHGLNAAKMALDQLNNTINSLASIVQGNGASSSQTSQDHKYFQSHIIFLSDGWQNEGFCPLRLCQKLKNDGVLIDCIGIGGMSYMVDENKLKSMASIGRNEQARYRFINDTVSLAQQFRKLAIPQVIS